MGARWDAVKKAWYAGPGVEPEKIAKWEIRHQQAATLDPRAEFAEVLRSGSGSGGRAPDYEWGTAADPGGERQARRTSDFLHWTP